TYGPATRCSRNNRSRAGLHRSIVAEPRGRSTEAGGAERIEVRAPARRLSVDRLDDDVARRALGEMRDERRRCTLNLFRRRTWPNSQTGAAALGDHQNDAGDGDEERAPAARPHE